MNDSCNVIGFIGVEKHDILMYLSRILYHLEQKILIIDLSEKKSLLCGLHQGEMDRKNIEDKDKDEKVKNEKAKKDKGNEGKETYENGKGEKVKDNKEIDKQLKDNKVIDEKLNDNKEKDDKKKKDNLIVTDFRGVHYYQDNFDLNDLLKMLQKSKLVKEDYDTILIDFGFTNQSILMKACSHLWYITDLQKYHVKEILKQQFFRNIPSYLLIKDVLDCKITPKLIQNEFNESIPFQKTFIAYQDSYDNKYKIECQYSQSIYFGKLSKELTEYLFQIIIVTYPEFTLNYIKKAYNMARKGR